jgi:hypothetical protein
VTDARAIGSQTIRLHTIGAAIGESQSTFHSRRAQRGSSPAPDSPRQDAEQGAGGTVPNGRDCPSAYFSPPAPCASWPVSQVDNSSLGTVSPCASIIRLVGPVFRVPRPFIALLQYLPLVGNGSRVGRALLSPERSLNQVHVLLADGVGQVAKSTKIRKPGRDRLSRFGRLAGDAGPTTGLGAALSANVSETARPQKLREQGK